MQDHTSLGHAMLAGSGSELLDTASAIAWSHHERFDGGGYPCGLRRRARSRWRAGSPRWRTRSTRSPPTASTGPRSRWSRRSRRCAPSASGQFDPAVGRRVPRLARAGAGDPRALRPAAGDAIGAGRVGRGRHAGHAAGGGQRALDLPQPAAAVGRRGPDRVDPDRRRASPLPAPGRPAARRRARRAAERAADRAARRRAAEARRSSCKRQGRQVAAAAAAAIYREGPPGWFASETAGPDLRDWLTAMAESSASGRYAGALQATEALMRRAHLHASSLLERHAFLERFAPGLGAGARARERRARRARRTRGGCSPRSSRALLDSDG